MITQYQTTLRATQDSFTTYTDFWVVVLDDKLKALVKEGREDKKTHERCYTAQDKYDIPSILKQIIDERIYYKDYEEITQKVLFDGTSYETSITALYKIIESGVFEK